MFFHFNFTRLYSVLIDKSNFTHQKACLINRNYETYNIIQFNRKKKIHSFSGFHFNSFINY